MAARPEPPAYPDTAAGLVAHVNEHPEDRVFYLRNMNGHATSIEGENATPVSYTHLTLPTICSV